MPGLFSLQSAAVLAIVGAGAGILVGNSAIDSINPFYYSPLPSRSFASLSPYRSTTTDAGVTQVSAEEGSYALGNGCVGCRTYPEEYRPDSSYEREMGEDYTAASLGTEYGFQSDEDLNAPEAPAPDPAREAVVRYASYRVVDATPATVEVKDAVPKPDPAATEHADAEAVRAAEDKAVPRGTEQLIY